MKRHELPSVILGSPEFRELNSTQALNLEARYNFLSEIHGELTEWLAQGEKKEALKYLLDNIELDAGAALNLSGNPEEMISAWLIHSTWTSDIPVEHMHNALDEDTIRLLDQPAPRIDSSSAEFIDWLKLHATGLGQTMSLFKQADSFAQAIALAIAINILFVNLLVALYRARLNRNIQTS
jgi:hypothetical protein